MSKIINRFDDCNKFSLTGKVSRYNIAISQEEFEKEMEKINPNERQKYLEKYLEKYTITEEEFLNALQKNGFDFSNITIDVSSLVNDSKKMTIMSLIEYIIHGVREKEGYGYDTTIIDPNDPQSTISVVDALEQVKEEHYNACLQAFQEERQSQLAEDAIDRDVKASKVSTDSLTEENNYGGNHI